MTSTEPQQEPPAEPDFYWENGCVVFTAAHHLRRGHCCGNGCRHCPYEGDQKRTEPANPAR